MEAAVAAETIIMTVAEAEAVAVAEEAALAVEAAVGPMEEVEAVAALAATVELEPAVIEEQSLTAIIPLKNTQPLHLNTCDRYSISGPQGTPLEVSVQLVLLPLLLQPVN